MSRNVVLKLVLGLFAVAFGQAAFAAEAAQGAQSSILDLTSSAVGYFSIAVFVLAYLFVMAEEFTHLRQ